ncbi:MAG: glycoside hydrolase family 31 protein, partial [Caldilineaceae bacterium]|nr:glycoside hydrolase family 31 protein [Caldilineaceae bacterium]
LVRVQHRPDGRPRLDRTWMIVDGSGDTPREGRPRDDLSPFPCPTYDVETAGGTVTVRTARLTLALDLADASLTWYDHRNVSFAADLRGRAYTYDRQSRAIYHYHARRAREHYFGFGERSGPLDKAGRRLRMLNMDALGYNAETSDPLYKHFPFYITYLPDLQIAYGLLYDNLSTTVFDLGQEHDNYYPFYRYYYAEDGDVDYYLVYGPTIERVVERLADLTGHMALPPRWSLGYLGSTMHYTDAEDAQAQLARFVELCAEHDIPCDLFHLSSGYTAGADGKRYVFTWNRQRVPNPQGMVDTFHRAGMKVAANIKPCLLTTHPRYGELAALGGFVRAAGEETPELNMFWGGDGSHLDFTNPVAYAWWQANVREQLLAYGIDVTWNDNNEFGIWDDEARCEGFGKPLTLSQIRPVQTLLMVRASYETQQAARPDERPFVLSRSGCPGMQRYAQTWSGDNETSWHTLRYNIPMGLGLSLSGMPNTGHDVGGFTGYRPEPELFLRWVQHGIFQPRFSIHSWHLDGLANEPWMYPEILPQVREAIRFRYRMIPYLYSLLFEAARTGHPLTRPLVYAFPYDPSCHTESFNFMLGPNLLVASVLEPGARELPIYLPSGQRWCDFHTGRWYDGGRTWTVAAPLDHIPLFVPAGGVLPFGKVMRHVGAEPDDLRELHIFPEPAGGASSFTWYEDDGQTLAYRNGAFARVEAGVHATGLDVTVAIQVRGRYPLPYESVEVVLPAGDRRTIRSERLLGRWRDTDGHLRARIALS